MRTVSRIMQTKFGKAGNCWQAAIASLLGLVLEDVPDFVHERYPVSKNEGETRWEYEDGIRLNPFHWQDTQAWLKERGLRMVWGDSLIVPHIVPLGWHLKAGPGPRGEEHVVLGAGDVIVHDPHPDGTGLVKTTEFYWIVEDDPGRA